MLSVRVWFISLYQHVFSPDATFSDAIGMSERAEPVHGSRLPLALIGGAICPHISAGPFKVIADPIPLIAVALDVGLDTFSVPAIISILADLSVAITPFEGAQAMLFTVLVIALIMITGARDGGAVAIG